MALKKPIIKKVTMWEASDEQVFRTREEALKYEKTNCLEEALLQLVVDYFQKNDEEQLASLGERWIERLKEEIVTFLKGTRTELSTLLIDQ